jgi:hypothetical protein
MQKIIGYFSDGIVSRTLETIGAEIETQFVDLKGEAISVKTSQQILQHLASNGWNVDTRKGDLITTLVDRWGDKIFYELGRHNIEVATAASSPTRVLDVLRECLSQLYVAASGFDAKPYFSPILHGDEDLLVIPDERDAIWLELDGREALVPLARTSSVQFTFSVSLEDAIGILNKLGENIGLFLVDFPQDAIWRRYINDSLAGYRSDRYGGPLIFESLNGYCEAIACQDVVRGASLVPFSNLANVDLPLYIRSVWWHFRLKRYGDNLCVEVRPMARRGDSQLQSQLEKILGIVC